MSASRDDHAAVRSGPSRTYYDGSEAAVRTPGYRPPPDRCRPMQAVGICEEGHTLLGRSSCGTRYCPDHWRDWCADATLGAVSRLAAYREAQDGAQKRLVHVVASPPQDRRYGVDALYETRSEAQDVLEAAGVRGGAMVVHPYRTSDAGDRLFEAAKDAGAIPEDHGKWKFLREVSEDWDVLNRYVEASPHYHALAAVEDLNPDAVPDGWVVKNIRSFERFHRWDTESYRDMARTAYYTLTHAAESLNRQSLTYFGEVHPSCFSPSEDLTAAAWDRIEREAEAATKQDPEERADHPEECPCEGCEAPVRSVLFLREFLDDESNRERVMAHRDGRKRWLRLKGLLAWTEGRTDRPPPGAVASESRMLDWLEERGEVFVPDLRQSSVTAF